MPEEIEETKGTPKKIKTADHLLALFPSHTRIYAAHEAHEQEIPDAEPQCILEPGELLQFARIVLQNYVVYERGQRELDEEREPIVRELVALIGERVKAVQSWPSAYREAANALVRAIAQHLPATEAWYQKVHAAGQFEIHEILLKRAVAHRLLSSCEEQAAS